MENEKYFTQILDLLENHFDKSCEFVLHNNINAYDETIIDIRNSHVTGRKIGDGGGKWGLEVMSNDQVDSVRYNKIMVTDEGKIIRNSSIFFCDENGKKTHSLCINQDISELVKAQNALASISKYDSDNDSDKFVADVNNLLDILIDECKKINQKKPELMNKDEKLEIVKFLNSKGAFLITKSGDRVCEYLKISKFTLYNYLEIIK